jgi:hypothetical protein
MTHASIRLRWWRLISAATRRNEALGFAIGAAVFPLEIALTATLAESPTTEIVVGRKRPRSSD